MILNGKEYSMMVSGSTAKNTGGDTNSVKTEAIVTAGNGNMTRSMDMQYAFTTQGQTLTLIRIMRNTKGRISLECGRMTKENTVISSLSMVIFTETSCKMIK